MIGTLAENLASGAGLLQTHAAETIAYLRGGTAVSLRMRPSNPEWVTMLDNGAVETWEGLDWIVTPDEWEQAGLGAPARGDIIQRSVRGVAHRYEVMAPKGMQLWEARAYNESYVIHTKEVAA
jgi:hypothetical protein